MSRDATLGGGVGADQGLELDEAEFEARLVHEPVDDGHELSHSSGNGEVDSFGFANLRVV